MDADQVELITDLERRWTRTRFAAIDAVEERSLQGAYRVRRALRSDERLDPDDPRLVRGGWDHEHCRLCWASMPGSPDWSVDAFRTQDEWLCSDCYRRYIEEDSLGLRTS